MFKIADKLSLPREALTQKFAFLGRSGSGKSTAATDLAEEFLEHNYPIAWIDPTGVAWGLQSSADGKRPGYPVVIFGGEHAHLPLEATAGRVVADFVVKERMPTILDTSLLGENDMKRLVGDFVDQLYRTNRDALHLFVDEADEFAPQGAAGGPAAKCHGAMQNVVRRGRAKGIGVTLITQRSAVIDKSILYQTECLVAMQLTGPLDQKAVEGWIKYHGSTDERDQLMRSLAKLPRGEGWVSSPSWLQIIERVKFRAARTFDSRRTPEAGKPKPLPKRIADVDLSRVESQMAATVQAAKDNDPRLLKAEIAALKKQLAAKPAPQPAPAPEIKTVEVPMLTAAERKVLERVADRLEKVHEVTKAFRDLTKVMDDRHATAQRESNLQRPISTKFNGDLVHTGRLMSEKRPFATGLVSPANTVGSPPRPAARDHEPAEGVSAPQQRILDALAWLESAGIHNPTGVQLGPVAMIDCSGGYFSNLAGSLSSAGLIQRGRGTTQLTTAGRAMANKPEAPPTLADFHESLRTRIRQLKSAGGKTIEVLNVIIANRGRTLTSEQLGAAIGVDHTGGYFSNLIGPLGGLGLIERSRGEVTATELLFPEGLQ